MRDGNTIGAANAMSPDVKLPMATVSSLRTTMHQNKLSDFMNYSSFVGNLNFPAIRMILYAARVHLRYHRPRFTLSQVQYVGLALAATAR
jgi:hypothetical protein